MAHYSWGNDTPTCANHWRTILDSTIPQACCGNDCSHLEAGEMLKDVASSPTAGRMDSVLWTSAELVGNDPESSPALCAHTKRGCLVRGFTPGGIDGFIRLPDAKDDSIFVHTMKVTLPPSGFRCVWRG